MAEVARLDLNPLIHDAVASQIDINKFAGIESGATADQTASEIEALYEGLPNTNKYTDSEKALLSSAMQSETITTLSINSNILSYVNESGNTTNIDLSMYLDDTNLSRLTTGSLNGSTGIATFNRDDGSTFTVDFSALFDDTQVIVNDTLTSTSTTEALSAKRGKVVNDALVAHESSSGNPHNVTKTQVGLSNVDNTSDVNKPVSTAQQIALDSKQNTLSEGTFANGDKTKLDNIENNATADQTASEILTAIKTVDGSSSGLDADKLDGMEPSDLPISTAVQSELDIITTQLNNGVW